MKAIKLLFAALIVASCTVAPSDAARRAQAPSFRINDVSAYESAGTITFTVSKTGTTGSSSTINYRTVDGTGTSSTDYVGKSGTLTFASGDTSKSIAVTLRTSSAVEPTKKFTVKLTAKTNARLADSTGIGTILDADIPPPTPPVVSTKVCWDDSVVAIDANCPTAPSPSGGDVFAASLAGAPDFTAPGFEIAAAIQPSWGTGAIPGLYGGGEGAFRFTCGGDGQILYDDPLLFPGDVGASHLHKFSGPSAVDANTDDDDLKGYTSSNCNHHTANVVNRSSYWMPAIIDDQEKVRNPDWEAFYYKRIVASDSRCNRNNAGSMGNCVMLPNAIRFIFGWDPANPTAPPARGASWYCTSGTGGHFTDLDAVFQSGCVVGATLVADLGAPPCWDGVRLDSTNHRDHVAYADYGNWGYLKCPDSHPYVIPQMETKKAWTVTADMYQTVTGTIRSRLHCSSDHMLPGAKPCGTMHADYWEKWDIRAKRMWMDNCINKGLDCSGGDFGNGFQGIGMSEPTYGWTNPTPRTNVPTPP